MAESIYHEWLENKQTRTIAFCSSIRQANFLASYFIRQGITCISLHSRTSEMSRSEAINRLTQNSLEVIFTVDLFNEGVDIPAVDTLLFARPTRSDLWDCRYGCLPFPFCCIFSAHVKQAKLDVCVSVITYEINNRTVCLPLMETKSAPNLLGENRQ